MTWELEDESSYMPPLAPAPPEPHVLDQVVPEIRAIFDNILKYRVDPAGSTYGITLQTLHEQIAALPVNNIVSTDSEYRYERKGHMYDPILQSFVQGAGGQISNWTKEEFNKTPVVLRGITKRKQMQSCKAAGRDFFYIDTGYFGNERTVANPQGWKHWHRIVKNNLQHGEIIDRPDDRLKRFNKEFRPWNKNGRKILIAKPDIKPCKFYDIDLDGWVEDTVDTIKKYTDRPVEVRERAPKRQDRTSTDTLQRALDNDVFALVTFNSVAAIESVFHGIPAFTLAPTNAASPVSLQDLSQIENPYYADQDKLHAWAGHLSYGQFHVNELRDGSAKQKLKDWYD